MPLHQVSPSPRPCVLIPWYPDLFQELLALETAMRDRQFSKLENRSTGRNQGWRNIKVVWTNHRPFHTAGADPSGPSSGLPSPSGHSVAPGVPHEYLPWASAALSMVRGVYRVNLPMISTSPALLTCLYPSDHRAQFDERQTGLCLLSWIHY